MTFGEAYGSFWKKTFDYRSEAGIEDYWMPTGLHLILLSATVSYFFATLVWDRLPVWPAFIAALYLLATVLPFISLTVRRLRDTGRGGAWAWLLLVVGVGTVIVMVFCTLPEAFRPGFNEPVALYGPPSWYGIDETPPFDPSENLPEPEYGIPEFDPAENQNVDVYGPPEWFERKAEPEGPEEEPVQEPTFDAAKNLNPLVYGPPEWFNPKNNDPEPVYGPPEWFDPEQNVEPTVYGRPEAFEEEAPEESDTKTEDADAETVDE